MFLPVGVGRGERLDGSNPPKFYTGGLALCLLMVVNTYGRVGVKLAPCYYRVQILSLYRYYRVRVMFCIIYIDQPLDQMEKNRSRLVIV